MVPDLEVIYDKQRGTWVLSMARHLHVASSVCFILIALFFAGCNNRRSDNAVAPGLSGSTLIKYATGFKVSSLGNSTLVEVTYPFQGATSGYAYLLVPRGEEPPRHDGNPRVIYTPAESIVCTSTTHIPLLDYLGQTDKLVGFPSPDYISSRKMRRRIEEGKVTDLGIDKGLNMERLALLNPDFVMGYTMSADYGQFRKIEALGIPVVINGEYLERHPLGRAEWIKFMGLFFDRGREADSIFAAIEKNYLETKGEVSEAGERPSVISGIVYGDAWFLPGGQNYAARLFKDAGCRYLFEDTNNHGYLELSFEAVYAKAHHADLWIGTGTYRSLDELRAADIRYTKFTAFQNGDVYNYDARIGPAGGNEFLELGYLRPDLILRDLVRIAHPEILPHHSLYFHRKLPTTRQSE